MATAMAALSSVVLAPPTPAPTLSASRLPVRRLSFPAGKESSQLKLNKYITGFSRMRIFSMKAALQAVDVTKVVPQADRILVRLEELPEKSVGGVLLPKSAVKFEHYLCGEVLSVGKETEVTRVGQKVLFSDLNAYEVNLGTSEKFCFVRGGDLLAVVE